VEVMIREYCGAKGIQILEQQELFTSKAKINTR
jgi:hypothetical protein